MLPSSKRRSVIRAAILGPRQQIVENDPPAGRHTTPKGILWSSSHAGISATYEEGSGLSDGVWIMRLKPR
jgi:hypothetical protein